jgi:hypothetical protein
MTIFIKDIYAQKRLARFLLRRKSHYSICLSSWSYLSITKDTSYSSSEIGGLHETPLQNTWTNKLVHKKYVRIVRVLSFTVLSIIALLKWQELQERYIKL